MADLSRRTETSTERAEVAQIEKSLKTSTYIDNDAFWESIHSGIRPQTAQVPNYKQPTKGEILGKVAKGETVESEVGGIHMDMDGFYKTAAGNMTPGEMHNAMSNAYAPTGESNLAGQPLPNVPPPNIPQANRRVLSPHQAMAIKKYPVLVEFLGREGGEKIAKQISSEMNLKMAELVHENSKEANEHAISCKADKQNLREYFMGDGWACRVWASGPFRGDEVIYYSRNKDLACVLRKSGSAGKISYADVSDQFQVIYEAEEGDIPNIVEQKEAEASVEKTTSAEGKGHEINEKSEEAVAEILEEST